MSEAPVARERRHTLYFLREITSFSPVFLDTEVDMGRVLDLRAEARAAGGRYSVVSFVLLATARALARHPEANAAVRGRARPRVAHYEEISGKLALDRRVNGRRVVLSAVLPGLRDAELDDVQRKVDHFLAGDPDAMPEYAGVRALHRLPGPVGAALFRRTVRPLARRPAVNGTFAVSSLGHRPVDGFHSVGGTTVTVGVGQIARRPAVRGEEIVARPLMRLSLTFDHRVIDGAEAADVLADIKEGLEDFPAPRQAAVRDADGAAEEQGKAGARR
jgi:hypothetical protein